MFSNEAGPYTLLRRIAVGGMGEVFLAQTKEEALETKGELDTPRLVVLKRILPHLLNERQFVDRFVDEAHLMTQLQHKNILPVYELRHDHWGLYMVMEYLDSYDLRSINRHLNQAEERWPPLFAVWVIKELCEGLAYAHQKKDIEGQKLSLIHRDVSPSNILVGLDGEVKIIDFGVARAQGLIHQSVSGSLQGKLAYMSPEQARSEEIDQRSDIYSVGLTLYEMLAGIRPREGYSEAETLNIAQEARDLYLEDVWPEGDLALCELVNRSLKANSFERFTHAEDFAQALEGWLSQNGDVEEVYIDFKTWLQQLNITKLSEHQLSLDAAMELQLVEGGSKPSSLAQMDNTLSLSDTQMSALQDPRPANFVQKASSGLLVSAEQQRFSSVLDEVIQEPELLDLLNQEKAHTKSLSRNPSSAYSDISPFRFKLILWGSIGFLLLLVSVVYWANTEKYSRFDIGFQHKIGGRLEQVVLESNTALFVDGKQWKPQQGYPLKQPIELCLKHPDWQRQCEWVTLENQTWYFKDGVQRERPLISFELKKKKSESKPSNHINLSLFKPRFIEKPSQEQQKSVQKPVEIAQSSKTSKIKMNTKNTLIKRNRMSKPKSPEVPSTKRVIEVLLNEVSQGSKLLIHCKASKNKMQYQWRANGLIEMQVQTKSSNCILKIQGFADLGFSFKANTKKLNLEPIPKGTLSLRVYPPAAQVYIDAKKVTNPVNGYELSGQEHTVRMLYQAVDQSGTPKNKEKIWKFRLKPAQKLRKFFDLSKE